MAGVSGGAGQVWRPPPPHHGSPGADTTYASCGGCRGAARIPASPTSRVRPRHRRSVSSFQPARRIFPSARGVDDPLVNIPGRRCITAASASDIKLLDASWWSYGWRPPHRAGNRTTVSMLESHLILVGQEGQHSPYLILVLAHRVTNPTQRRARRNSCVTGWRMSWFRPD